MSGDLVQLLQETVEAYNAGDPERIPRDLLSGWISLGSEPLGGVDRNRLAEAFSAGRRTNLHWAWLYTRRYGDTENVVIASGTLEGWIRLPGGQLLEGSWAFHRLWVKEGKEWKKASGTEFPAPHEMKELEPSSSA